MIYCVQFLIIFKKIIADNKCYMEKRLDMFKLEKAKRNIELSKTEMFLRKRKKIEPSPTLRISSKVANTKSKIKTKKVNYNYNLILL